MKEEIKKWFDQASSDLDAAQDSITSRHFDWACFQAQQAAEKGLKALYLQTKGQFRKIHDLNFLGKELGLPEDLLQLCGELSRIYTETRYPDADEKIPAQKFSEKDARYFVDVARKILQWLNKKL